jgi:hypothetical protein
MTTLDIPRSNGRAGRARPGKPWQRHDLKALRIERLADDLEAEADRHPEGIDVQALLALSATALRVAAASIADPET